MDDNQFKDMTDEQLIAIISDPFCESSSQPLATAELHRRQKQQEGKNIRLQKWILVSTIIAVIIAAITLIFVIIQFFQSPLKAVNYTPKAHLNSAQPKQNAKFGPGKALEPLKEVGKNIKH